MGKEKEAKKEWWFDFIGKYVSIDWYSHRDMRLQNEGYLKEVDMRYEDRILLEYKDRIQIIFPSSIISITEMGSPPKG